MNYWPDYVINLIYFLTMSMKIIIKVIYTYNINFYITSYININYIFYNNINVYNSDIILYWKWYFAGGGIATGVGASVGADAGTRTGVGVGIGTFVCAGWCRGLCWHRCWY